MGANFTSLVCNSYRTLNILHFSLRVFDKTVTSRSSDGELETEFALTKKRLSKIRSLVERLRKSEKELSKTELVELGETLFIALFNGDNLDKFKVLYTKVAESEDTVLRLELIFSKNTPEISQFPWEFLCVPVDHRIPNLEPFLAVSEKVALVRNVFGEPKSKIQRIDSAEKLRVGTVISNPHYWGDLPELGEVDANPVIDILEELQEDSKVLFRLEHKHEPVASKSKIRKLLSSYKPHILHFIGHGDVLEVHGGACLVLIDDETTNWEELHTALPVSGKDICALFDGQIKPSVVFLQSCNTANGGSQTAYASMAAQIAQAGIPVVVAMQYEIQSLTAEEFSKRLYKALADGDVLEVAVNKARQYLYDRAVDRGFGTPVIYITTERSQLFTRTASDALLDNLTEEFLALFKDEKGKDIDLDLHLVSDVYSQCFREETKTTLLAPLVGSRNLKEWGHHLAQATPIPGKSRPLAYFAETLADRLSYSEKALKEKICAWVEKYKVELEVDLNNRQSLVLIGSQSVPPFLQVVIKPYPDDPSKASEESNYDLIIVDGKRKQQIFSGEKLTYRELPGKVITYLNELYLTTEEAAHQEDLLWIEVYLPTNYLSLKVEQWPTEDVNRELGQIYKVVVCSLYRCKNSKKKDLKQTWPRNWIACNAALNNLPTSLKAEVATGYAIPDLTKNQIIGLPFQPDDELPIGGGKALTKILDSGVPIAVWVRRGTAIQDAEEWLKQHVKNDKLRHLANQVRQVRIEGNAPLSKQLVLLWDNYDHKFEDEEDEEENLQAPEEIPFM